MAIGLVPAIGVAGLCWAGIEGSKHDFSKVPWSGGDTCGVCHVPHREEDPKAAPLWDQNVDLSRRFGSSLGREVQTKREPARQRVEPGPGTLSCLRCHDGTIAKSTISGVQRERFVYSQHPGRYSTAHEATDHPVGIAYPQIDEDYRPIPTVTAQTAVELPNGRVECTSCHDPHNESGANYMLVMPNGRSALCLACHDK
jgi:predicted CXXCH cytochrome family protein